MQPDVSTPTTCPIWKMEDSPSFKDAAKLITEPPSILRDICAYEGQRRDEVRNRIVDVHRFGRQVYSENIRKVGRNIFPLIIARDTEPEKDRLDPGSQGVGGIFTLYLRDGQTRTIQPTAPGYEILKSLSHQPLALFVILSPYFQNRSADAWMGKLATMQDKVRAAKLALAKSDTLDLEPEHATWAATMLEMTDNFISTLLDTGSNDEAGFTSYAQKMRPHIRNCMDLAAMLQMDACMTALTEWKTMLGPDEWRKLYVVITTIWPVSEYSPRWQLFRTLMDDDMVGNHLLTADGVRNVEDARDFLGRIVADRYAARLILGTDDMRGCRMTQAISSKTDVVADSAYAALRRLVTPQET